MKPQPKETTMTVLPFPQNKERSQRLALRRRSYGELPFTPRWAEAAEEKATSGEAPSAPKAREGGTS